LAFAVAPHLEPEILIVDEVLAVGDAEFQKECLGKMEDVARGGRTVLLVSHNMQAVASLCSRAIWLEAGAIRADGESRQVIADYLARPSENDSAHWRGLEGDVELALVEVRVESGADDGIYRTSDELVVRARICSGKPIRGLICALEIYDRAGTKLVYSNFDDALPPPADTHPAGTFECEVRIPGNTFAAGDYGFQVDLGVHNVRRVSTSRSRIDVRIENLDGIGRRYPAHTDVLRPDWPWNRTFVAAEQRLEQPA
jgi:lipopolysaccharide transport system ATP-binding protein